MANQVNAGPVVGHTFFLFSHEPIAEKMVRGRRTGSKTLGSGRIHQEKTKINTWWVRLCDVLTTYSSTEGMPPPAGRGLKV